MRQYSSYKSHHQIGAELGVRKASAMRLCMTAVLGAIFATSVPAHAQSQGSGSTTVIAPVTVENDNVLNFGRIVPGDIVTILRISRNTGAPDIIRGDALPIGGTVERAEFAITAEPSTNVQITLPDRINIIRDGGNEVMRVNRFRLNNGGGRTVSRSIESDGTLTVFVSAQLRIFAGQEAGVYRGNYDVTVEYN